MNQKRIVPISGVEDGLFRAFPKIPPIRMDWARTADMDINTDQNLVFYAENPGLKTVSGTTITIEVYCR